MRILFPLSPTGKKSIFKGSCILSNRMANDLKINFKTTYFFSDNAMVSWLVVIMIVIKYETFMWEVFCSPTFEFLKEILIFSC